MSDKPFRNQCERSTSSNRRSTIALRCSSRPSDMLGSYEPSSAGTCCARLLGRLWLASDLKEWEPRLPRRATYRPEGRTTGQWRCRICSFRSLAHRDWKRKNGTLYTTSFYACSRLAGTTKVAQSRRNFRGICMSDRSRPRGAKRRRHGFGGARPNLGNTEKSALNGCCLWTLKQRHRAGSCVAVRFCASKSLHECICEDARAWGWPAVEYMQLP